MRFMSKNKLFTGVVAAMLAGVCLSGVQAQNTDDIATSAKNKAVSARAKGKSDAVLFKVHDIASVKNTDGDVVACEFKVTFYNRSPKDISGATVLLNWKDKVINGVIDEELKRSDEKNKMNNDGRYVRATSATEKVTPIEVNASVDMPAIKAYKQLTLSSRLQSDRCFLLLGNTDFKVSSCTAADSQSSMSMSSYGNSDCGGLFKFVSSKEPDYYKEFKKISYDEEKAAKKTAQEKDTQEMNKAYGEAVDSLNSASSILSRIK